jgi:hypothetical protein
MSGEEGENRLRRPTRLLVGRSRRIRSAWAGGATILVVAAGTLGCGGGGVASQTAPPALAQLPPAGPAREVGREACRGASPLEIARRYEAPATDANVRKSFAKLVAHPTAALQKSPGYPRLVAALYASTVPVARRALAAAGCAEELASR